MMRTPAATAPAPARRNELSGIPADACSNLRPSPGESAHSDPSITRTSPSATARSLIASGGYLHASGRGLLLGQRFAGRELVLLRGLRRADRSALFGLGS